MKTYDEKASCPKCGCKLVETKYSSHHGKLVRRCERCEHAWHELPLDEAEKRGMSDMLRLQREMGRDAGRISRDGQIMMRAVS